MKCEDVRDYLGAYCAGELDSEQTAAIGLHISKCPACEREHRRMATVMRALTDFEEIEPSIEFRYRLWSKIEAYEAGKRALWVTALAGLLARNRRLVVTACAVFAISLFAGIYGVRNMRGGAPMSVAKQETGLTDAYVIREIPEGTQVGSDTVYTHFVTGDRPVVLTSQPQTGSYRRTEGSGSNRRMTF
jgi:hypothetical protein